MSQGEFGPWPSVPKEFLFGGEPFVLCPELTDENVTTGNTGSILCLSSGYKINSFLAIQILPGFPVVIY